MKRKECARRSRQNRRQLFAEALEPRLLLAVDTWILELDGTGNVDLFGPNAAGDLESEYKQNPMSDGNIIATSNVPGQNNQAPIAVDDALATDQNTALNGDVLAANPTTPDSDPDSDPITVTKVNGVAGNVGMVTALSSGATVNVAAAGTFTYDPNGAFDFLAAGAMTTDTFSYTIADPFGASDSAVVTVTITGVNDAPTATNLNQTKGYLEDAASVALDDIVVTDPDNGATITATLTLANTATGSLSATSGNGEMYMPGTGIWTVTGSVTTVNAALAAASFVPAANNVTSTTITTHIEDQAPSGPANGVITLTATAVNDEPSFTKGPNQTVLEDAGAQTVPAWATAISKGPADESGQTLSFNITSNSNMPLFSAQPAVSASGQLTYTPAANANGSAVITLNVMDNGGTANGGDDTSPSQSFTITVTAVNDEPSFTKGPNQTVLEDASAQSVPMWATALSKGPANEAGQTLSFNITGNSNAGLFSVAPAVSPSGNLTYTPAANANGSAVITLNIMDDGGTTNGGDDTSPTQTFTINVTAVNDEPSFTKGLNQTVLEDAGAQSVPMWATALSKGPADEAGQTLSFNITGNSNAGLFSVAPAVSPSGTLTYTPAANANGSAVITLNIMDNGGTANGGDDTSPTQTFTINVTAVNDEPSFAKGPNQTVLEDAGAQSVPMWATALSKGPADEAGQTLSFNITGNNNAGLFSIAPAVSASGNLTYTPAANANGSAVITLNIMDNGGTANFGDDTSPSQSFTITVTPVNDAPSFTKGPNQTVLEDAGPQSVPGWAMGLSPGPANEAGQTLSFNIVGNTNTGLFSAGPSVNTSGDLTYTPTANANGSAVITLNIMDNGGTANGGVDTSLSQSFTITVTSVNDAPVITSNGGGATAAINVAENTTAVTDVQSTDDDDSEGSGLTYSLTTVAGGGIDNGLFTLNTATGVLTFTAAPDFEMPADNDMDNDYEVQVTVTDSGSLTDLQNITVTVTNVNEAPIITSNGGGATAAINVAENTTAVTDVQASDDSDSEGSGLTYSLTTVAGGGIDNGLFTLNTATGVLTFTAAPDFEMPADNDMDNDYEVQVTVTDSGSLTDLQNITVTVTNVNEAPIITSNGGGATAAINVAENTTAVTDVQASDDSDSEGSGLTYSLTTVAGGGIDNGLFTLNTATGVLTFTAAPNFEMPADNDMDNDYEVQVTVTDSGSLTDLQNITVTVTNVNEAPIITSNGGGATAAINVAENTTAVTDVQASDDSDSEGSGLTYSLTTVAGGGTDNGLFTLNTATGVLTFTAAPDFEMPADNDMDNDYEVQVTVTDSGSLTDLQNITVTVTNVNEAPIITSNGGGATAAINVAENTTAVTDVQSSDDSDSEGSGLTYSLTTVAGGGIDNGLFTLNTATGVLTFTAAPDFEMPADNDMDNDYEVQVTVTDSGSLTDLQNITVTVTNVNEAPIITSNGGGATAAINVAENTTAVTDVQATDDSDSEGSGLTYSLTTVAGGGTDNGLFTLNTATGVLTFTAAPDFEMPADNNMDNDYEVQVTVTDSGSLTDLQNITVTVTDVAVENTAPVITSNGGGATAAINVAENTTAVTDVQTTDDNDSEGSGLTYSLTTVSGGGADNSFFTLNTSTGVLTFTSAPDYEMPADAGMNNVYDVQVTVTDSGPGTPLTDVQDIAVTVTNVNEPPVIANDPIAYATAANTQLRVAGMATTAIAYVTDASSIPTKASVTDPDSVPSYSLNTPPTSGTAVVSALGAFLYTPNAGFVGMDSFVYKVSDGANMVTGTVNVTVSDTNGSVAGNQKIWYVENNATAGGDGTSANPFDTLAEAQSAGGASGVGDTIFLLEGDGTTTGQNAGVILVGDQLFIGHTATTLVANGTTIQTPTPGGKPKIGHGMSGNAILLGSNNTVLGIDIGNTGTGTGIVGTSFGTLTIDNVQIDGTGSILNLNTGTVTDPNGGTTFTNLISTGMASKGIDLNAISGGFSVATQTSITSSSDIGVEITSSPGTFSFADLDITTTNDTGLFVSSSGTVNSTSGTISTGSGKGVDIDNTALGITLTSVSVNGAANGIDLATTTGSFTVTGDGSMTAGGNGTGGTILNATGDAVILNSANNVTLRNMNITNPTGHGINADNLTGVNLFQSLSIKNFDTTGKDGITVDQQVNFTSVTLDKSHIFDDNGGVHSGNDGFRFVALDSGTATGTVNVTNSEFNALDGDGIQISNDATGTITTTITGNNLHDADSSGGGNFNTLSVGLTGNGVLNATIGGPGALGNTLTNVASVAGNAAALSVAVAGPATGSSSDLNATIENNTVTGTARRGIGVQLEASGGTGHTTGHDITIKDNNVQNTGREGIHVLVTATGGRDNTNVDITISGNMVGTTSVVSNAGNRAGILVDVGDAAGGSTLEVDVLVKDNTAVTNNTFATGLISAGGFFAGTTVDIEATLHGNTFTNNNIASGESLLIEAFGGASFSPATNIISLDLNSANVAGNRNTFNNDVQLFNDTSPALFKIEVDGGDATVNTDGATYSNVQIETFLNARNDGIGSVSATGTSNFRGVATVNEPLFSGTVRNGTGEAGVLLTEAELAPIVEAAINRWAEAGLSEYELNQLRLTNFVIRDLQPGLLGNTFVSRVVIDVDADGIGWFVDATPADDAEFQAESTPAGMDLLTVVMHELGHVLGRNHSDDGLMAGTLDTGTRRLPGGSDQRSAVSGQPEESGALDMNGDGLISPIDALLIFNAWNHDGAAATGLASRLDVDGDGAVTQLDANLVFNYLNQQLARQAEAGLRVSGPPPSVLELDALFLTDELLDLLAGDLAGI